jgi:putative membrane protein
MSLASQFLPIDHWNRSALVVFLVLWGASCIHPPYPDYFLLQHAPTVVTIVALAAVQNRLAVSRLSYTLILVFMAFHLLGARYCYSNVPYDRWFEPILGYSISGRNHYDRLVHFLFGLLIVVPSWRFCRRVMGLGPWWSAAVAFSIIMTAGALYEILEWVIAMTQTAEAAESYNGQQGDPWDPYWDTILAGLGSLIGLALIGMVKPLRAQRLSS